MKISIVYFSGYGHTKKQAEAVAEGAKGVTGADVGLIAVDQEGLVPDDVWPTLEQSAAIVFGSPTYMGGPAWQFKRFVDGSSKPWFGQKWKDKVAAGFTNSASLNGDKFATIAYFQTLAMQHGMIWVGTGMMPASAKADTRESVNALGGFGGALAQSPSDASAEEAPNKGDLETARQFGQRVAEAAAKLAG